MAEEVIERLALNRDPQLPGIGPVQLHQLAGLSLLRKEHLPLRTLGRPPMPRPPVKGAQVGFFQPAVRTRQKILKERLGLQLRSILQHGDHLVPNLIQGIGSRPPGVRRLQFRRALARFNVFACRVASHIRLQRTDQYFACLFVFTHEPFVLLVGNHFAAAWNQTDPRPAFQTAAQCYRLTGNF